MIRTGRKFLKVQRPVRGRGFVEPNFSRGAFHFMRLAGRLYLRIVEGVSSVVLQHPESLISSFRAFENGEKRLIIAFRHAARMDAPVLLYAVSKLLGKAGNSRALRLRTTPHVRFLYGKDVLNWAGAAAAWLFPRIGNIPIVNGRSNKEGLSILKEEITAGMFPISLAPEGQVTYHMYRTFPLANGTASLARWGMEAGQHVQVLPVAIGYRYSRNAGSFVGKVLQRWEQATGIPLSGKPCRDGREIVNRLIEATDRTLQLLEEFYSLPAAYRDSSTQSQSIGSLRQRIALICETALHSAESMIGIHPAGTWLDRLFRIRYAGVDCLYPDDHDPRSQTALKRNWADFRALKAAIYLRHSQIVDILEYIDPGYIYPGCQEQRYCEYALNILDIINRLQGGDISTRFSPKKVQAYIVPGDPIDADQHFLTGTSRKESLVQFTGLLQTKLEELSDNLLF